MVLLDFHGLRVSQGGKKTITKTIQKKERRKRLPKTDFLQKSAKNEPKMSSDLDHEFSPNLPPRGHFPNLEPKGAKRGPKGTKREPKGAKSCQKER